MVDAHLESRNDALAQLAQLVVDKSTLESRLDSGLLLLRRADELLTSGHPADEEWSRDYHAFRDSASGVERQLLVPCGGCERSVPEGTRYCDECRPDHEPHGA
jgi:hypothetical protein